MRKLTEVLYRVVCVNLWNVFSFSILTQHTYTHTVTLYTGGFTVLTWFSHFQIC